MPNNIGPHPRHRHLDADEAVVLGAGLFAANLSTTFRLRKFGMTDKAREGRLQAPTQNTLWQITVGCSSPASMPT